MKKLYEAKDSVEAHIVQGALEAEEIEAVVLGVHQESFHGGPPSVWIVNLLDCERAQAVLEEYLAQAAAPPSAVPWTCPQCGEESEAQFTECWKCGMSRPPFPYR